MVVIVSQVFNKYYINYRDTQVWSQPPVFIFPISGHLIYTANQDRASHHQNPNEKEDWWRISLWSIGSNHIIVAPFCRPILNIGYKHDIRGQLTGKFGISPQQIMEEKKIPSFSSF